MADEGGMILGSSASEVISSTAGDINFPTNDDEDQ